MVGQNWHSKPEENFGWGIHWGIGVSFYSENYVRKFSQLNCFFRFISKFAIIIKNI